MPGDRRALRVVMALLAVGGMVFPLVGASLLAVLLLDVLLVQARQRPGAVA